MTIPDETYDEQTHRRLWVLVHHGVAASERQIILEAPPRRRAEILGDSALRRLVLERFPEGLPDTWLKEAIEADWARWYREGRR